ncbi:hypothetical protein ACEPAF_2620 [Sanghuangporus sanghuang]
MSKGNFYLFPSSPRPYDSVRPRELLPLREPPAPLLLYPPVLPAEARARPRDVSPVSREFALSTHVIPAAYPRVTPLIPLPSASLVDTIHSDSSTLSKEERKKMARKVTEEIVSLRERCTKNEEGFLSDEREDRLLWNCVTRYYRKSGSSESSGKRSITLLLLHANGLPKETWEPFLRHLITSVDNLRNGLVSVDEIWSLEATQHGDAALINEGKLGAVYDWQDQSRDILNFLSRYLPSRNDALRTDLPVHLPRVSSQDECTRLKDGFTGERTLVGIGHSMGGATVTLAAITRPALFSSLILVDPVITPPYIKRGPLTEARAFGAVQRRHTWKNREEARKLFAANPFFAAWDPEVLDNYVQYALAFVGDDAGNGVKLKMPGVQEAVVFAESRTGSEIFERLKDLDPCVALHWIMAGKGSWITGSEAATCEVVWQRPANSSNTQLASEHLIVQQAPKELAREVHEATYMLSPLKKYRSPSNHSDSDSTQQAVYAWINQFSVSQFGVHGYLISTLSSLVPRIDQCPSTLLFATSSSSAVIVWIPFVDMASESQSTTIVAPSQIDSTKFWKTDQRWHRVYVCLTWMLDTAHQVLLLLYTYGVFVKGIIDAAYYIRFPKYNHVSATFGDASTYQRFPHRTMTNTGILAAIVDAMVQIIFVRRAWYLSQRSIILTGLLSIAVLGQFAMNVVYYGLIYNETELFQLSEYLDIEKALNCVIAFTDTLLSVVLIWLLRKSRSGFQRSDSIINHLIMYTVGSGFVTSIWMVMALVGVGVAPHSLIYALADMVLPKLYLNCMLASLNARSSLRAVNDNQVDGMNIRFQDLSTTSAGRVNFTADTSRKVRSII